MLTSQIVVPVFEIIFKHNNAKRTLEIYLGGDRTIGPKLRVLFARAVLGEEIDEHINQDAPIYDTRRVVEPGFTFRHSADWHSWRQLSVFECFETVCGVIERSVQAHLG